MAFDYTKPPNNIPDAIQWLINGLQSLFRRVNGTTSGGSGGGTVTSVRSSDDMLSTVTNPTTTPVITIVSAPKLKTARNINGTSFDGAADITITAVPSGLAGGDLSGTYPNPIISKYYSGSSAITGGNVSVNISIPLGYLYANIGLINNTNPVNPFQNEHAFISSYMIIGPTLKVWVYTSEGSAIIDTYTVNFILSK